MNCSRVLSGHSHGKLRGGCRAQGLGTGTRSGDTARAERSLELEFGGYRAPPHRLLPELVKFCGADHPDAMLLRFLRARKWDVEKAADILSQTFA